MKGTINLDWILVHKLTGSCQKNTDTSGFFPLLVDPITYHGGSPYNEICVYPSNRMVLQHKRMPIHMVYCVNSNGDVKILIKTI